MSATGTQKRNFGFSYPNFQNHFTRNRNKSKAQSGTKTMHCLSAIKKDISLLKPYSNWKDMGFTSFQSAKDCLTILSNHTKDFLTNENTLFEKKDDFNVVIGQVFLKLQQKTDFHSLYWYKETQTLRLFKPIESFDMYSIWILETEPFFRQFKSFSKPTQTLLLSFLQSCLLESFSSSECGVAEWFFQIADEEIEQEVSEQNGGVDENYLQWYQNINSAKEQINDFSSKKSFSFLLEKYLPKTNFESQLKQLFQNYQKINMEVYYDMLNYIDFGNVEDEFDSKFTQSNLTCKNVDTFTSLFTIGYQSDDNYANFYVQHINDRTNNEYAFNGLNDYMDISKDTFGSFLNPPKEQLLEFPNFIQGFNELINNYKPL